MKVTNFVRSIAVTSATINEAHTLVTVNTTGSHLLTTGDFISLNVNDKIGVAVTVTSATQFTYAPKETQLTDMVPTVVYSKEFQSGSATSVATACGSISDSTKTFQAVGTTSSGTGSAIVSIDVSNDGTNFLSAGTITLTLGTAATSDGFVLQAPWLYIRANCTTLTGTGTKVKVLMGSAS